MFRILLLIISVAFLLWVFRAEIQESDNSSNYHFETKESFPFFKIIGADQKDVIDRLKGKWENRNDLIIETKNSLEKKQAELIKKTEDTANDVNNKISEIKGIVDSVKETTDSVNTLLEKISG